MLSARGGCTHIKVVIANDGMILKVPMRKPKDMAIIGWLRDT